MNQIVLLANETGPNLTTFILTSLGGVAAGLLALIVERVFGSRRR